MNDLISLIIIIGFIITTMIGTFGSIIIICALCIMDLIKKCKKKYTVLEEDKIEVC